MSSAHTFICGLCLSRNLYRVTAIADKLGVEFALIHRKRDGKSQDAPEHMEILVGDVRDKVDHYFEVTLTFH